MRQDQQKILLIAVSAILAAILQFAPEYFIYLRSEMWTQPWRFITAHWVHVGWIHYLLNLIAFICFPFIFPKIRVFFLVLLVIFVPILMSLAFYFFYPKVDAYAGFSGVLHGLYGVAAIMSLKHAKERPFATLILIGLAFKLIWEVTVGELSATMRLIGSPILIEAHQLGVLMSLIVLISLLFLKKWFRIQLSE